MYDDRSPYIVLCSVWLPLEMCARDIIHERYRDIADDAGHHSSGPPLLAPSTLPMMSGYPLSGHSIQGGTVCWLGLCVVGVYTVCCIRQALSSVNSVLFSAFPD